MKLAIVLLPIVFAVIWMLFIGLRINKRGENRKLIINWKAYYSHYKSFGRIIMTQHMQLMVLVD